MTKHIYFINYYINYTHLMLMLLNFILIIFIRIMITAYNFASMQKFIIEQNNTLCYRTLSNRWIH